MSAIRQPTNVKLGIAYLLAALIVLPVMDGVAKHLGGTYSPWQITWARYIFNLVLILPLALGRHGLATFYPARLNLQVLRSVLSLASTFLFFGAIRILPLAEALSLAFLYPLIVIALAATFLREHVSRLRWIAVGIGFAGALVVIRPGASIPTIGTIMGLGCGLTYAGYVIATRQLAGSSPAFVTLTWSVLFGAVVTSATVQWVWIWPGATDWLLLGGIGLMGTLGQFLVIRAFENAPATTLAPFAYGEIATVVLVGYVGFGELPDRWTWLGMAIITAGGLLALSERAPPRPAGD